MNTITIKGWRQNPALKKVVEQAFPDYRKLSLFINTSGSVTFHDLNWSDGTKAEYRTVTLGTDQAINPSSRWDQNPPWAQPAEGKTSEISEGTAVLSAGTFCGKPSTLTIYINPNDKGKFAL